MDARRRKSRSPMVPEAAQISSLASGVCRLRLRRATDVAMMESADLGQRNDAAVRRWLDRARLRRILLEGEHPLALSCFCGCPPIRINPKMVGNTRESLSIC